MKVAIFDVDGTLVDSVTAHAAAWQDVLREFGFTVPFNAIREQIGKGSDELLKVFLSKQDLERLEEQITERRVEIFKDNYQRLVRPFPGCRKLFRHMKDDGWNIVLGTSGKEEELKAYFPLLDIEDLIEAYTSADDADKSKPHPDIFEAALAKVAGAKPSMATVVGDTPYDAEAAVRAGMTPVGVLTGGFPEQRLRQAGCAVIFRDLEDLLARYDALPPTR